jgi:hypothetical protein
MRLQRRLAIAAGLSCLALMTAAPPAAGGGTPDDPCRQAPCRVRLHVADETARWRSFETFYPQNEEVATTLRVSGRKLRLDETFGPSGCRSRYAGSGLVAIVKACGDVTPLRVRANRFKGKRRDLVIAYQALPAMRGD